MKKYVCAGLLSLLIAPISAMEQEEDATSTTIQTGPVTACSLSGEILATSNSKSQDAAAIVTLWSTKSKNPVNKFKPKEDIGAATQVAQYKEKLAAAYSEGFVIIFDSKTGQELHKIAMQDKDNRCLLFSEDGASILTSWARYNVENGKFEKAFLNSHPLKSISPDGKWGESGYLGGWVEKDTETIWSLDSFENYVFIKFGGNFIVPAALTNRGFGFVYPMPESEVLFCEYLNEKVIRKFAGFETPVDNLTRNLESTRIAGSSKEGEKVIVWDIDSSDAIKTIESKDPQIIELNPVGSQIAIASEDSVEVVDIP